jgi:nicotinate-nucleotide pyrophosphorylase (carboxylating)
LIPQLASAKEELFFCNRKPIVVSGLQVAEEVFRQVDPTVQFERLVNPGDKVPAYTKLAKLTGSYGSRVKGERVALNFLQLLSGTATRTREFVDQLLGTDTNITDTRKTIPGLRILQKQAVYDGQGIPHRYNLGSGVLLKDNHKEALGGNIKDAILAMREQLSHMSKIEVEVENMDEVKQAVEGGADVIMLDNLTPDEAAVAVKYIKATNPGIITEVSGGIGLDTVREYAVKTGVDVISTGDMTQRAPAVDIGLDTDADITAKKAKAGIK